MKDKRRDEMVEKIAKIIESNVVYDCNTGLGPSHIIDCECLAEDLVDNGVRTADGFHATECICPDEGDCNPIIKPINYSEVDNER